MYSEEQYELFAKSMEERHPRMLSGKYGGFAVGPGWWSMIETLFAVIQSHIDQSKGECPQVVVEQIKEKFGGLRFYYQGGDDFIHGAVWLAESLSAKVCEECGAPGKRTSEGWVKTLCDFHLAEREALRSEEMRKNGFEE
jgi:hypothetical protein